MPTKRTQPAGEAPDIPKEKAYVLLKEQLEKLKGIKAMGHLKGEAAEKEWFQLTSKIMMRSFGGNSPNVSHFRRAASAGNYFMVMDGAGAEDHRRNQTNFEERLAAYESALRSSIAELEIDLEPELKGVYEVGQEYEFYTDIKNCLSAATKEIFIIEPYPSTELFDVYAQAIPRTVQFRLLTAPNLPSDVKTVAQKYAAGGNFAGLRTSMAIHDRVLFIDKRAWVAGQSIKDAAKKKPT